MKPPRVATHLARFSILVAALAFLNGCAPRYNIVLNNGQKLTARGKPSRDQFGFFTYRDASGKEMRVSAGQVRTVEPVH